MKKTKIKIAKKTKIKSARKAYKYKPQVEEIVNQWHEMILIAAIQLVLPELVEEWNTRKLSAFENLYEDKFSSVFKGLPTQEITKRIAPMFDAIFLRLIQGKITNFEKDDGKGRDYKFDGILLESKINFTEGNGWTGNGFKKTAMHILFKFVLDEHGKIQKYFAMLVNLGACKSKWSKPAASCNFSSLQFLSDDVDNLHLIAGDIKINKKWLKPILLEI